MGRDAKPFDLRNGHVIKTCSHILVNVVRLWACAITELCCSPVLLYEIQFTVVFWVEVANVTSGCYLFFQVRLLVDKIRLHE
jgi:hypothetical protein